MPQVFNINQAHKGIPANIRSVRCWFWPSVTDQSAEVAMSASHYVVVDFYDRQNAGGNLIVSSSIDTGDATALQRYTAVTLEDLLAEAFG